MVSTRVTAIVCGLMLSYLAVYFGDSLHNFVYEGFGLLFSPSLHNVPVTAGGVGRMVSAAVSFLVGAGMLVAFLSAFREFTPTTKTEAAGWSALCTVCAGFIFGVLVTPIEQYGFLPWQWIVSQWIWLLAVGLVPSIFVIKDAVIDSIWPVPIEKNPVPDKKPAGTALTVRPSSQQ